MFTSKEYDEHLNLTNDELLSQLEKFGKLVGKLQYLIITRPYITYSVKTLRQCPVQPKKTHYDVALQTTRYVKEAPGQGLLMRADNKEEFRALCDSD